jgi:hypothetical protein
MLAGVHQPVRKRSTLISARVNCMDDRCYLHEVRASAHDYIDTHYFLLVRAIGVILDVCQQEGAQEFTLAEIDPPGQQSHIFEERSAELDQWSKDRAR